MLRLLSLIAVISFIGCSPNNKIQYDNLEIVIQVAQSYKYDLDQGTYTIFNTQGDTTIHFSLTAEEKRLVVQKYYDLKLDRLPGKQTIEDECMVMPKLYTTLFVKSTTQKQEIIIDEACNEYKGFLNSNGKNVASFLKLVDDVLKTKPEIKNAPTSDIMYL